MEECANDNVEAGTSWTTLARGVVKAYTEKEEASSFVKSRSDKATRVTLEQSEGRKYMEPEPPLLHIMNIYDMKVGRYGQSIDE